MVRLVNDYLDGVEDELQRYYHFTGAVARCVALKELCNGSKRPRHVLVFLACHSPRFLRLSACRFSSAFLASTLSSTSHSPEASSQSEPQAKDWTRCGQSSTQEGYNHLVVRRRSVRYWPLFFIYLVLDATLLDGCVSLIFPL